LLSAFDLIFLLLLLNEQRTYAEQEQIESLLDDNGRLATVSASIIQTTQASTPSPSSFAPEAPRSVSAALAVARLSSFGPIYSRPVRLRSTRSVLVTMDTPHSPMVTTVFISAADCQTSSSSCDVDSTVLTLPAPPLPPPPLQFAGHESSFASGHTSTLFADQVLSNYSVHVPPPTHFATPTASHTQLLQVRQMDSTSFTTSSPHRVLDQQQLLAQQIEQYRQKQFELDRQTQLFDQLEVSVAPNQSHKSSSQQPTHHVSSLLLRTALLSQSNGGNGSQDNVGLTSTNFHSPTSNHSDSSHGRSNTSTATLFTSDANGDSLHHDPSKCDDREEVESGVGRSDTCSEGLDSLCGRSCSDNASGCTDRIGRLSADSALRITLTDAPLKHDTSHLQPEAADHESSAYAFCARRPVELTNCTHQIKFTKTPGFSCLSCLLLLLSLLLLAVFLSSAIFFARKSSLLTLYLGQFLCSQSVDAVQLTNDSFPVNHIRFDPLLSIIHTQSRSPLPFRFLFRLFAVIIISGYHYSKPVSHFCPISLSLLLSFTCQDNHTKRIFIFLRLSSQSVSLYHLDCANNLHRIECDLCFNLLYSVVICHQKPSLVC
jgi:hypothetical protein